jgi:hypothetical protein
MNFKAIASWGVAPSSVTTTLGHIPYAASWGLLGSLNPPIIILGGECLYFTNITRYTHRPRQRGM